MAIRPGSPATDPTMASSDPAISATAAAGAPAAGAMRPGTIVAETYEVTRLIGQGGMGAVWEAKHLRLPDKRVVVKVLLYGAADAVALARFRREAEIASRLGHPNIVAVLDFNTLPDGTPYIVLELLQGETLAARLHRERPTFEQTMAIVRQIGSALAAAHREGVVHRDLKPDNVFLTPTDIGGEVRDVVKILDFGISKIRGANTVLTQDAALIGTPQYMAPEQATGRNDHIDARTDIFAFGAIVFEMLGGRPPFLGDTLASVVHAVVYAPTPSLQALAADVPPAIVAAIERALAKTREERFPDVGSFVKAVTAQSIETPTVRPRMPTVDAPGPTGIPTEKVARRGGVPVGVVVVGILLAVGVGGVVMWKRGGDEGTSTSTSTSTNTPTATKPSPKVVEPLKVEAPIEKKPELTKVEKVEKAAPEAKKETISPAAAADLDEAEAALEGGKTADAIRLAQHSLYAQKTSRAYAIMARARCAQGDLGNAKAALAKVAARDRAAVTRACGKMGVDLH